MKLLITSSRTIKDRQHFSHATATVRGSRMWTDANALITGLGSTVDCYAGQVAYEQNLQVIEYPAEWSKLGKGAGLIRNSTMAGLADSCIAVWDGQSAGTKDTILRAHKAGAPVYIHYVYSHPVWPIDQMVWQAQRFEVLKSHKMMGRRWIENWFSNFFDFKVPFEYEGLTYECPECFYQAMKSQDPQYREKVADAHASKAKRLGRKVVLRDDWEKIKYEVMFYTQKHRYTTDEVFRQCLLDTRGQPIIEWNNWGDKFWGTDIETGEGQNQLGRILMILRDYKWEV